ncbi:hypothetical protein [Burkholderia sp. Bp8991]|uniref:hypothetical protein n=1 Tax=Burkholderia sp. Bp8991 TaxID=2184553 RepID=UPI000F5943B5|nr:hypothetical protein [Burkholderia sp. Bp8991]RQS00231.1 hypothetical protein DIE02_27740 [Burkholderia sp. Bp8991]
MDKNFLEDDGITSQFARATRQVGGRGGLNAEPLMGALDQAIEVARGIAEVLHFQTTNAVRADNYANRDDGEAIEPPVSDSSMSALLGLARVASDLLVGELERVARWTDEHGAASALLKAAAVARAGAGVNQKHAAMESVSARAIPESWRVHSSEYSSPEAESA